MPSRQTYDLPAVKAVLEQLQSRYLEIAKRLGVREPHRFFTEPQHDGSAHIEFAGTELRYIVTERGQVLESRSTYDPDELLFWLVEDLTWSSAASYEVSHRIPDEDSRRQLFSKHVELLKSVNREWAALVKARYDKLVERHPWNDE